MKKILSTLLAIIVLGQVSLAQGDTTLYEHRPFQFTFLFPPLSTNGFHNVNIINGVSLNLFVGVSGGVDAFEAGSFINIDRYYMKGVQLAGFGNTVGAYSKGAQLSGFFNVTGSHLKGLQGAGFVNVAGSWVEGAQVAGFANVAGDTLTGFQGAGFVNVAGGAKKVVQAAGFGNVSGGGNTSVQGSGFFNVAKEVEGAQLAGFINVAGKVKGVQLSGFINICDSIDGVPLSVISVVKKNGYRNFGFSLSEVQYANITYRMGVKHLYNIYSFGKPFGPGSRWMYGGGLGTEVDLTEQMILNIEGTVHQELWIGHPAARHFLYIDRMNLHNALKFLFGWNMEDKVRIHVGPTFNVAVAHSNPEFGRLAYHPIAPYTMYNHTRSNYRQTNVQTWIGVQGGISF
jgi:hypothetical protein